MVDLFSIGGDSLIVHKYGNVNDMPRGWANSCKVNKVITDMWIRMHSRVANNKYYRDCTVCDSWMYLSNFVTWIKSEKNYGELVANPKGWTVDKDGLLEGNRIYCPEYCQLITKGDNSRIRNLSYDYTSRKPNPKKCKVINLNTAKVYETIKDTKCDGYDPSDVGKCCRGKRKSVKGHKFMYLEDFINLCEVEKL